MAGRIPHGFIDDLLARSDIVAVIGETVALKKKGRDYMACCPFHNEKTPSFSVSPIKQFFHCFGCGIGGNVLKFLMESQHLDFIEAVEVLAQRLNIEVPREGSGPQRPSDYKKMLNVLEEAAAFYTRKFQATAKAGRYLKQRSIDQDTATQFRIGYAPAGFNNLEQLDKFADSKKLFLKTGLLAQKDNNIYDRFRDRIIFPIRDRRGQVIAFGGRALTDDNQPKYLNSPESEVFQKRRTLYGIYELRQAKKLDHIIIVEGYMDVISLATHGIDNCVATLGTAVTQDHIKQLFKLCPHLIFCFDGDTAGRKAAVAGLKQMLPVFRDGYEATFAFLPDNEDPDSLIRDKGKASFEALITQAKPLSAFLFAHLQEGLDLSTPEGGTAFAERARPLLSDMPLGTFRDLILKDLVDKTGLEAKYIMQSAAKKSPYLDAPKPRRIDRHYSTIRIAALLLVGNPGLANKENTMSITDLGKLEQPGALLLADIIHKIQTCDVTNTASLLELYRNTEHEDVIRRLAAWSPPQDQDEAAEFKQAMEKLTSKMIEQEQVKLIDKLQERGLTQKEEEEIRALQQKLSDHRKV